MHVVIRRIFALWILSLCGGSAELLLSKEVTVGSLTIQNPEGLKVTLRRVGGDRIGVGTDRVIRLDLQADRYVVEAGATKWAAPLVADLLPEAKALELTVGKHEAAPKGFVLVPGGPTLVGDVLGVGAVDERPAKIVTVASFLIAETETTNAQYVAFLNAKGTCDDKWIDIEGPKCGIRRTAEGGFKTDSPKLPVVTVSYLGAMEYCAWSSKSTGMKHRLPSEIEWERMAQGPDSLTYAYGDVYNPAAANQESGILVATKTLPATGWGVYDATGNAFEWTSSDYASGMKVLRGGSYVLDGPYLRNSFRMWYRPQVQADDISFRVLCELKK